VCGVRAERTRANVVSVKPQLARPRNLNRQPADKPPGDCALPKVIAHSNQTVTLWQADFRDAELPTQRYDVILAAAVLNHLRDDEDWQAASEKIWSLLKPGGSVWITDWVVQETDPVLLVAQPVDVQAWLVRECGTT